MTVLSLSWADIERQTTILAESLSLHGPFTGILAVTRGGMMPALLLAHLLDIRTIDTIGIVSYHDRMGTDPRLVKKPSPQFGTGQGWIVVDDLVDSGTTFATMRTLYPHPRYVALYAKPQGKLQIDDYVTEIEQNIWLEFPWEAISSPL